MIKKLYLILIALISTILGIIGVISILGTFMLFINSIFQWKNYFFPVFILISMIICGINFFIMRLKGQYIQDSFEAIMSIIIGCFIGFFIIPCICFYTMAHLYEISKKLIQGE